MARVTLVTRNFPPLTGGMERLIFQVYRGLCEEHEVAVVGPRGCESFVGKETRVLSTSVSPTPWFLVMSLVKGLFAPRPDIVVGGSGVVAPIVVLLSALFRARSVVFVHGLDIIADSAVYQRLFVPFLRRVDLLICNSGNTARLALAAGVPESRLEIVNPGVELPHDAIAQADAKEALGLRDRTVLLSVGRLIPRKGLAPFIANCLSDLARKIPDVMFVIAGSEPQRALNRHDGSVRGDIETAVTNLSLDEHVQMMDYVDDATVALLYGAADAFMFPLVDTQGDVEGFGMVAVEAAAAGTPTVAFDCGGVSDAIAEGVSGFLVPAGDYQGFTSATLHTLGENMRDQTRDFARSFSWENYYRQLRTALGKVANG